MKQYYGLQSFLDMITNNEYFCHYPEDINIDNIKTSHITHIEKQILLETSNSVYSVYSVSLCRSGDILNTIIINGNSSIKEVKIVIDGITVYVKSNINDSNIKLKPFEFGIPCIALCYSDIQLLITTTSPRKPEVITDSLFLDDSTSIRLCKETFKIGNWTIEKGLLKIIN